MISLELKNENFYCDIGMLHCHNAVLATLLTICNQLTKFHNTITIGLTC